MIFLLFQLLFFGAGSYAQEEVAAPTEAPSAAESEAVKDAPKESADYEVDYEEELSTDEGDEPVLPPPSKEKTKKSSARKGTKDLNTQGSRAEKKIAPLMKSETKSIYRRNGKALDVDTD